MTPEMAQFSGGSPFGTPDTSLLELAVISSALLFGLIFILTVLAVLTLPIFFAALFAMGGGLAGAQNLPDPVGKASKIAGLVFRSLRRNLLRTALTYVALFVLTGMLTFIYSLVSFLGDFTAEKEGSQLVVMSEKFSIPSMMKPSYPGQLRNIIETKLPAEHRPKDIDKSFMTWSFVGGSLASETGKRTQENSLFMFALDPKAIRNGMMDEQGLNPTDLGPEGWAEMLRILDLVEQDKRNVVIGEDRLKVMGKKVGDTMTMYGLNYSEIEFEYKIVGAFPAGTRMGMSAAMRFDYLTAKLDEYAAKKGKQHPFADKCVNLV